MKDIYKKFGLVLFDIILKTSQKLFNWEPIQNIVDRFRSVYGKEVAKAVGLFIELFLVIAFYNLIGVAIGYIKGFDSNLIPILVNILAGLQLVVNKYQRNIESNILNAKENK